MKATYYYEWVAFLDNFPFPIVIIGRVIQISFNDISQFFYQILNIDSIKFIEVSS